MTLRVMSMVPKLLRSSVLQDVASGLVARVLPGVASLVAVPILVHALGPERYAAVGLLLTIQMLSGLLEIGFTTGITRQAAWLTGTNADADKFAVLLRSFEIPYLAIAAVITIAGIALGQTVLTATFKIHLEAIDLSQLGVIFMFAIVGIRFPFHLYISYLTGRGKIQRANFIYLTTELLRIVGAVSVVVWLGPALSLFFGWQLLAAVVAVLVAYFASWATTPPSKVRILLDWRSISEIRGLMFGASNMTILFIVANSLDKLFLPRFVNAAEYGFYVATSQLAISIYMIVQPVWAALNPRLLSAFAAKDFAAVRRVFLTAAGLMTALCCALLFAIMIATPSILHLWIGVAATHYDVTLIALCAGYAMAALSLLALTVHQAASRYFPSPLIFMTAIIVVPLSAYFVLARIDASSVAIIWSVVYLIEFLGSALAFRLYASELSLPWLVHVLLPLVLTMLAGVLISFWTHPMAMPAQLALAVFGGGLAALLVAMGNPSMRDWVRHNFSGMLH